MLINIYITVVPGGLHSGLCGVVHPTNILRMGPPLVLLSPQTYPETRSSAWKQPFPFAFHNLCFLQLQ